MRGSVHKRTAGASWYFTVDVGRDPITGKRKLKTKGGFRTRKEAERALAEVVTQVNAGAFSEPTKQTVADFLREWHAGGKARGLRRSTLVGNEVAIERWIVPRIGALPLAQLSPGHLNKLYSDLLVDGRVQGRGGLSPRSVRIAHSIIRRALKDAVRWGRLTRNVADLADPPSTAKTKAEARASMKLWSADELRLFLESVRDDRLYAAWLLAASTGMRRGELLGLRYSDLDLEAKRLTITQTLIAPRYELQLSEPKTATGRRTVSLDEATVSALREHRRRQLEERLALGEAWGEHPLADDLVFRDEAGWPLVPMIVTQRFQTLSRRAGLPTIKLHALRHLHATMLMTAGVPLPAISDRLGHSSASFTADYYSHVRSELQADTAEVGAALIWGAGAK